MAEGEHVPGRGPQHDERHSRDRQLGNAAQPARGAVIGQNALPAPGVEHLIAAIRRLNGGRLNGRACLRVRPLHSLLMHGDIPSDSGRDTEGSVPSSVDRCLEEGLRARQRQGKAAQRFGQVSTPRHMDTNGRGVKDGGGPLRVFRWVVKSEHEGLNWWGRRHARKRRIVGNWGVNA
jgi:hypothetical protein